MKKLLALFLAVVCLACVFCGCGGKEESQTSEVSLEDKLGAIANGADRYIFGTYEQDGNTDNGTEDIEWVPFAKAGDSLVAMVSKYCIDVQPYVENPYTNNFAWEDSKLALWLNSDFINTAFSEEEKTCIATTGQSFQAKVSILDDQQEDMLPEDARMGIATEYVKSISAKYPHSEPSSYWIMPSQLIYAGAFSDVASWITADGVADLDYNRELSVEYRGVRPVIFVDISSVK